MESSLCLEYTRTYINVTHVIQYIYIYNKCVCEVWPSEENNN